MIEGSDSLETLRQSASLLATRVWHRARRPLTAQRAAFMWMSRSRPSRANLLVRPDSVLTIEAPMRSGNTFAAAAFLQTNGDLGHVARHIHTPAHVLQSLRLQIPTMVIVRDPEPLAVSHVLRRPALTLADSLIDYAHFFESLEPVRDELVVASFEEVTARFDVVVQRLNEHFGRDFTVPAIDEDFTEAVTRRVEEMNRQERVSDGEVDELRVARPSELRAELASGLRERLVADPANRRPLERARLVYQQWS